MGKPCQIGPKPRCIMTWHLQRYHKVLKICNDAIIAELVRLGY